jgi:aminoglycoside/choline kinase family phosphotransferase
MNLERDIIIDAFLTQNGWAGAKRSVLAGDASFRRYDRIELKGKCAVLMDALPPNGDVRPFITIAKHLIGLGYSAPSILATDEEAGLLLIEDFGDNTYTQALSKGGDEMTMYELAIDVLVDLHKRPVSESIPRGLPTYGNGRLLDEVFLTPQWAYPALTGMPASEDMRSTYGNIWLELFTNIHAGPKTLVLRDYHVDNLIWLDYRSGIKACGLLDFQDAVAGHPAYDLMSLLEDARRDLGPGVKNKMIERYLSAFPKLDRGAFEIAFSILAAQRHAKVIGIFTRLCQRDGKPAYLVHIPRVWALLEATMENPVLTNLRDWFDTHMPSTMRGFSKTAQ